MKGGRKPYNSRSPTHQHDNENMQFSNPAAVKGSLMLPQVAGHHKANNLSYSDINNANDDEPTSKQLMRRRKAS